MTAKFLDYDPLTGAIQTFEYDEENKQSIITETTDVSAIIENNKRLQNETDGWSGPDHTFRKAASIPMAVVDMWKQMYGIDVMNKDHLPAVMKLLNSNEWAFLRTNRFNL